ncbi:hypothetical protein [Agromyces sp. ZXT2-3]|uniref:hypothetical protein n=1 Tax=Agromyces sp. ZXT2-3 TaxID=3461152 RepID=UPI004054DF82
MTTDPITDDDAEALLRGRSPRARAELSPLADAIAGYRMSSSGGSPRPSAAVASRLDPDLVSAIGVAPGENPDMAASAPAYAPPARRRRVVMEWFAGLGLATKISVGAAAAIAVGATGAGAAGAAGMLPEPAQVVFDQVAGTEPGVDRAGGSDLRGADGAGDDERATGLEHAEERAGSGLETAVEHADENAEFGLDTAEENAGSGIGTGAERSADAGQPAGAGDQAEGAADQSDGAGDQVDGAGSRSGDHGAADSDD